jgi:hypothetical protein
MSGFVPMSAFGRADLNLIDVFWTDIPQIGCWHPHASRGAQENVDGLAFTTFIPNALHQPGLAAVVTNWMVQRARLLRERRWPDLADKPIGEIFEERFGGLKPTQR